MQNLLSLRSLLLVLVAFPLVLASFPLVATAQTEVVDTVYDDVKDIEDRIASLPDSLAMEDYMNQYMNQYMNRPLDSLIEAGDVVIDNDDPVYKPGMTYGEYENASQEHLKNQMKEAVGDMELPKFTLDAATDKAILEEFMTKMFSNPRLRAETPTAALVLMLSNENSGIPFGQDMFTFVSCYFQIAMSSFMEYSLYKDLGGKDTSKFQLNTALLSGSVGQMFQQLLLAYPDEYKARIDSITEFIKRLDWLGDIYPDESLLPREVQDSLVLKYVDELNEEKAGVDLQLAIHAFLHSLFAELYQDKEMTLENYFTPELCDKIRHKKMKLSVITPNKKWKNWDSKACCQFRSADNDYIYVYMSKYPHDESTEADEPEDSYDKDSNKNIVVKIDPTVTPLRISDFMSAEDYWKSLEDEYPADFMPAP